MGLKQGKACPSLLTRYDFIHISIRYSFEDAVLMDIIASVLLLMDPLLIHNRYHSLIHNDLCLGLVGKPANHEPGPL